MADIPRRITAVCFHFSQHQINTLSQRPCHSQTRARAVLKIPGPPDSALTTLPLKSARRAGLRCDATQFFSRSDVLASLPTGAGADKKITTNLSIEPQIFVVGRHLENRRPDLRPFRHRGLVDGGGEKRHVVVDVLGENREGKEGFSGN